MKAQRFFGNIETCALSDSITSQKSWIVTRNAVPPALAHVHKQFMESGCDRTVVLHAKVQHKLSKHAYGSNPLGIVCNVLHGYS